MTVQLQTRKFGGADIGDIGGSTTSAAQVEGPVLGEKCSPADW